MKVYVYQVREPETIFIASLVPPGDHRFLELAATWTLVASMEADEFLSCQMDISNRCKEYDVEVPSFVNSVFAHAYRCGWLLGGNPIVITYPELLQDGTEHKDFKALVQHFHSILEGNKGPPVPQCITGCHCHWLPCRP